jgi:hypothetical protein
MVTAFCSGLTGADTSFADPGAAMSLPCKYPLITFLFKSKTIRPLVSAPFIEGLLVTTGR